MEMTQQQLENWSKIRQRGRTRYIWWNGVFCWGLLTGALWAVAMAAMQGWSRLPFLLVLALILFPIGGFFYGCWTWKVAENRYRQASQDSQSLR